MLSRLSASPVGSSSRLAPLRVRRRSVAPSRGLHLSPTSLASSSPDPDPAPEPEPSPRPHYRAPPHARTTTTKPKKVDPHRKTPQFEPNPLSRGERKEVFSKRKLLMEELMRFMPSQKGKMDRPDDHDSEPLHNYGAKENGFSERMQPSPPEWLTFRRVTAQQVAHHIIPPTSVKMLARDHVDDHLYNPSYGYFSSANLEIFTAEPFDIPSYKNGFAFQSAVGARYAEYSAMERKAVQEKNSEYAESPERRKRIKLAADKKELWPETQRRDEDGLQVWHTPTELFKPWYGRAIARALVSDYKLKHFPYEDFIIYEMGAGNGTLMTNIMDYLREDEPEVYERTQYRIIEITTPLAKRQMAAAKDHGHSRQVEVVNKSIFDWDEVVNEPCYFVGLEVLDNFAHDMIRYDLLTGLPLQAVFITDPTGDYHCVYEPITDPLIAQFLALRSRLPHPHNQPPAMPSWYARSPWLRWLRYEVLFFAPNLTRPEWIPTKAMVFLEVLRDKFPKHRLLLADFSELDEGSCEGWNAPVVQTRQQGETIPVTTVMVKKGFFDIFFPTNFPRLLSLYHLLLSLPSGPFPPAPQSHLNSPLLFPHLTNPHPSTLSPLTPPPTYFASHPPLNKWPPPTPSPEDLKARIRSGGVRVWTHEEFLTRWEGGDKGVTNTRDGEDVMRRWFLNAKFLF